MGVMSSTARKVLSPTAVALGASVPSEEAEGAYIPLKAFAETGSAAAKALYKKAKQAISDGADPDDLYRRYAVYKSEDGQYKVDVPEIKARNREYAEAVSAFVDRATPLMERNKGGAQSVGTMGEFLPTDSPIFEYFPDLRNVEVRIVTPPKPKKGESTPLGHFIPSENKMEIFVPNQKSNDSYEVMSEDARIRRAWVGFGTLVHEFQHYLQANKGSLNSGFNTLRGAVNKREADKEIAALKDQIAQAESMPDVMSNPEYAENVAEMKDQLRRMESAFAGPQEVYVRVLGELEAESTAMKATLTGDERLKVGVFYPKMRDSFFSNAEATEKAIESGRIKEVPKDEVLVRTEDEHSLDFAGGKVDRVVLADDPRAKTSKGFVDLPSSGFATLLGLDMTRRALTDTLDDEDTEQVDEYVQGRTGFKASDTTYAESDLVTDTPIIGDALFAADLLSMIGSEFQMEEGEEQPEAVDEFTGVEEEYGFASPDTLEEDEMKKEQKPATFACGGSVSKKDKGMLDGGIMALEVGIEEVPAGSLPEEVADDVPAMLSEGEYVVPADVVRWHGLKALEGLRTEAKMGLGIMDADGRIKGHQKSDSEEEIVEDGGIEDNDYAKDGIMAADGGVVSTAKPSFYRYTTKLNPDTGRYEFVPVAVDTNEVVTPEQFDPAKGTRYGIANQLGEIYQGAKQCDDGYAWDEETQSCVPVAEDTPNLEGGQASVVNPSSGEGTAIMGPSEVQYADQATTKIAEFLGPLSAEQLEDQEGDTLADKAVSRMFQPTDVEPLGIKDILSPIGAIIKSVTRASDAVGAKRAAITRSDAFTEAAKEAALTGKPMDLMAYNFNYDPETASFTPTTASTQITSLGTSSDGTTYVQDWNQLGSSGTSYNLSDQNTWDNMTDDQWDDVFDQIDSDFDNLSVSTGANQVTTSLNDSNAVGSTSSTPTYTPNYNFNVDYSGDTPTFTSTPNTTPSTPSSTSGGSTTTTTTSKVTDSEGNPISDGRGGTVQGRTTTTSSSDSSSSGGGCVIATHGVMTGGFSVREKAAAELYCIKNFHGTWWGEAFRRGYRYTGNKHISNGTAEDVYQEFKDFVKTGRGLKKDVKSRLNWAKRVVQFIVLGLTIARKD